MSDSAEGRYCGLCGTTFGKKSMHMTISVKWESFIEKIRVCPPCHHKHMQRSE